ncbi:helix-turn-helix transcriptional regulator [Pseudomonas sp. CAM1A]|uniref:helix-turn-helix transcriptional regulator n=1 Tax=Pseudomonas sp. CAM1A TaxID=3231717 RepID=UPI0039C6F5F4
MRCPRVSFIAVIVITLRNSLLSLFVIENNTLRVYPGAQSRGTPMNHVRQIRKGAGISQASLRRKLDWNQSRLANYEAGRRAPGLEEARQIVSALNQLGATCALDDVFPVSAGGLTPSGADSDLASSVRVDGQNTC